VNANRVTYVDDLPFDVIFRITGRNENTPKNQFVSDGKTARKNSLINKEHRKIKLDIKMDLKVSSIVLGHCFEAFGMGCGIDSNLNFIVDFSEEE